MKNFFHYSSAEARLIFLGAEAPKSPEETPVTETPDTTPVNPNEATAERTKEADKASEEANAELPKSNDAPAAEEKKSNEGDSVEKEYEKMTLAEVTEKMHADMRETPLSTIMLVRTDIAKRFLDKMSGHKDTAELLMTPEFNTWLALQNDILKKEKFISKDGVEFTVELFIEHGVPSADFIDEEGVSLLAKEKAKGQNKESQPKAPRKAPRTKGEKMNQEIQDLKEQFASEPDMMKKVMAGLGLLIKYFEYFGEMLSGDLDSMLDPPSEEDLKKLPKDVANLVKHRDYYELKGAAKTEEEASRAREIEIEWARREGIVKTLPQSFDTTLRIKIDSAKLMDGSRVQLIVQDQESIKKLQEKGVDVQNNKAIFSMKPEMFKNDITAAQIFEAPPADASADKPKEAAPDTKNLQFAMLNPNGNLILDDGTELHKNIYQKDPAKTEWKGYIYYAGTYTIENGQIIHTPQYWGDKTKYMGAGKWEPIS